VFSGAWRAGPPAPLALLAPLVSRGAVRRPCERLPGLTAFAITCRPVGPRGVGWGAIIELFEYDLWANGLWLETLRKRAGPPTPLALLAPFVSREAGGGLAAYFQA